jgi:hypothetical protein
MKNGSKKKLIVEYATCGPFELTRKNGRVDPKRLEDFWSKVKREKNAYTNLDAAIGVYIVATRIGKAAPKPWYVGRTYVGFRNRFSAHLKGETAFDRISEFAPNGSLYVFLIARLNESGKFTRPRYRKVNGKHKVVSFKTIERLEFALIGSCLLRNKNLINTSEKTFHSGLSVPGYLNDKSGPPAASARTLAAMLKKG